MGTFEFIYHDSVVLVLILALVAYERLVCVCYATQRFARQQTLLSSHAQTTGPVFFIGNFLHARFRIADHRSEWISRCAS